LDGHEANGTLDRLDSATGALRASAAPAPRACIPAACGTPLPAARDRFAADSPLEEGVSSEPVSEPNSLLAGKIQGISSIWASEMRQRWLKTSSNQCLTGQFPTHPNREFFAALQGIKSGDQGNFRPDQGKRPSNRVLPVIGGTEDLALSPPWGLTRQPRSPKRLGHRVAASGHGIAWVCARLGGSGTFLRSR
jgi:hypothetical protein